MSERLFSWFMLCIYISVPEEYVAGSTLILISLLFEVNVIVYEGNCNMYKFSKLESPPEE